MLCRGQDSISYLISLGLWCPLRTCFFLQEAMLGKILTIEMLMRRRQTWANWCSVHKINKESANHILIQSYRSRQLWDMLLAIFGVRWVLSFSFKDLLLGWKFGRFNDGLTIGFYLFVLMHLEKAKCLFFKGWRTFIQIKI